MSVRVCVWRCEVDLTMAGHGRIAVDIRGEVTRPLVEIAERCEGLHTVSFVPQECCLHSIVITMNGVPVPGQYCIANHSSGPGGAASPLCVSVCPDNRFRTK